MKKLLLCLVILVSMFIPFVSAEEPLVLKSGVSMVENLPTGIFGTWRINSQLAFVSSSTPKKFNTQSVDLWTLLKMRDYLNVSNPLSGASTNVNLESVQNNTVTFSRISTFNGVKGRETITITVNGNLLSGNDKIVIKKLQNGKIIGKDVVEYKLKGEKISGTSIF